MDPAKILIVEDNTMVAEDCRLSLEALGYAVTSIVATGEEAVEEAESDPPPDAVLMDIRLRGEMDGIEAAERINAHRQIPVVFLSAYSDNQLLQRARKAGSFGFLVKPFEERELFAMLEMAIYKARAERERREMEVRLRQAKKLEAVRTMAGGIAHLLNNRLTVVIGNLEISLEDIAIGEETLNCLHEAEKSALEAAQMGRLLLTYLGKRRRIQIAVDLSSMIRKRIEAHRYAASPNVDWAFDLPTEGPRVQADPTQLAEVLNALLTNARESIAAEPGGKVRISAGILEGMERETGHQFPADWDAAGEPLAYFSVGDNGVGMDENTIHRIFDPFFTDKFLGRGMGLSIVFGIVQTSGGCIAVRSRPGKGTTMTVYLPLKTESDSL